MRSKAKASTPSSVRCYSLDPCNALNDLQLTGILNINGTGNGNHITGNAGNNILDGVANLKNDKGVIPDDTVEGGAGDDTYIVHQATDVTIEDPAAGHDTVKSAISWTLAANFEDLVLTG